MKKNFLVTTGLADMWEFNENNFLLGKWCEFYKFDVSNKRKPMNQIPKEISIIRNVDHWNDLEKRNKVERFKFNDYFEGNLFHWDSQTTQHEFSPKIMQMITNP